MPEQVRSRSVLQAVLLRTLAQHPEGLAIQDAYDSIHSQYSFPSEWYREIPKADGYDVLAQQGYPDWRTLSQERLIELVSTEPQWQNELRWSRNDLRERGFLDTTAPRGVWKLTTTGMRAARKPEEAAALRPEELAVATPRPTPRLVRERAASAATRPPSPGLRESLYQKLKALTASMPLEDLDLLVDIARAVRTRSITKDAGVEPSRGA